MSRYLSGRYHIVDRIRMARESISGYKERERNIEKSASLGRDERIRVYLSSRESQLFWLTGDLGEAIRKVDWCRRTAGGFCAMGRDYETSLRSLLDPVVDKLYKSLLEELPKLEEEYRAKGGDPGEIVSTL